MSFFLKLYVYRIINDYKWDVENQDKWTLEDSNRFNYDINETGVDK